MIYSGVGTVDFLPIQMDTCGRLRLIRFPLLPRMAGFIGARMRDQPKLDSLVKFSL